MAESQRERVLVVGVGNEFRADDGAGLAAARRLRTQVPAGVAVVELQNDVTALPGLLESRDLAIIIDAAGPGLLPGRHSRFNLADGPLPTGSSEFSTHGIGLGSILEIARLQGNLPLLTIVYGIGGRSFDYGIGLSPEVECAVSRVVEEVCGELDTVVPSGGVMHDAGKGTG
jgi:hydrogenase maturation protease